MSKKSKQSSFVWESINPWTRNDRANVGTDLRHGKENVAIDRLHEWLRYSSACII